MHSQRLSRQFERTVIQLRNLQETRRAKENHELNQVVDIIEMYESQGQTYDPSDHGFVFSEPQIESAIRLRTRERLAEEAYEHNLESAA
jgi:cysteinyl-tRNA synthetase